MFGSLQEVGSRKNTSQKGTDNVTDRDFTPYIEESEIVTDLNQLLADIPPFSCISQSAASPPTNQELFTRLAFALIMLSPFGWVSFEKRDKARLESLHDWLQV